MSSEKKNSSPPSSPLNPGRKSESVSADTSRGAATRHLLVPEQLRESIVVARPPSLKIAGIAGLQASLALFTAIVLAYFSPWAHLLGFPALGALASLFGRYAPIPQRMRIVSICALLLILAVLIPSLASFAGASSTIMVMVLALLAGASTLAVNHWRLGGPGAVIIVFAVGGALAPVTSWQGVIERTIATAAGGVVAWIVCKLTDHMRAVEMASLNLPTVPRRPLSHELLAAGRITVGAAIAALIAHAAGWSYPAWAAIGATAVMQGGHLHVTMNRALQRMAGTIVGALIVWAILSQAPSFWVLVGAVVIFQFLTEVIIGFNYALGQITVTPMALLMTYLVAPVTTTNMPMERVLDTILGAAIGIVFAVIFSTVDDRAYLAKHRNKG